LVVSSQTAIVGASEALILAFHAADMGALLLVWWRMILHYRKVARGNCPRLPHLPRESAVAGKMLALD